LIKQEGAEMWFSKKEVRKGAEIIIIIIIAPV
jgi:hypothetical protein